MPAEMSQGETWCAVECHPASTFERKQRRHFRRHNRASFGHGLTLAPGKDAETHKFLAAYTRKDPLPEKRHYEQPAGFFDK
ncbi:Oidioi.mRNA.OKI2018_I69.PAR.g9061.t1.cds [Oikopleura dioica]|uniref:Oidioi.mRNA.OKI2018_I69.PAR.g9061.t1.cds n=1 Tax=Oikopleura dioica TaxID=34765 RepID=A0ABN7RIT1_OIKDI|nr:Oidioi.mRNA.OKI2018_I69.PAR.g9061.t1.cds [Oikopleura dioica]